jgi:hypothetical protein
MLREGTGGAAGAQGLRGGRPGVGKGRPAAQVLLVPPGRQNVLRPGRERSPHRAETYLWPFVPMGTVIAAPVANSAPFAPLLTA